MFSITLVVNICVKKKLHRGKYRITLTCGLNQACTACRWPRRGSPFPPCREWWPPIHHPYIPKTCGQTCCGEPHDPICCLNTSTKPARTELYPQRIHNPTLFCCTFSGDKENNIMSNDDKKEQSGGPQLTRLATVPSLGSRSAMSLSSFELIEAIVLLSPATSWDGIHVPGSRSCVHDISSSDTFSAMSTRTSTRPENVGSSAV